ncbi:transposase, partial [Bacteroidota bacterium]
MINYTPQNQLSLSLFKHPFREELNPENRWVKLASLIPWDELAAIYSKTLQSDRGRYSVDIRTVIAALIVKHKLKLDDRGTVDMIQENIYLQYFCGLKEFTWDKVFDPSLFVDIRKRLGGKEFEAFNKVVIEKSEQIKPHQARIKREKSKDDSNPPSEGTKNYGTLKVDATVADQEIKFPTDVDLLNTGRENLERMIKVLYKEEHDGPRPRTYPRVARKTYLNLSKKKKKSKKHIRKALKAQLQYVTRDIKIINLLLEKPGRYELLDKRDREILE